MEKFCIVTNLTKDKNLDLTNHIKEFLEERGKTCVVAKERTEEDPLLVKRNHLSVIPEDTDLCIVLGGDGTLLQAARSIAYMDIPIIGVNLGQLGYLTEVEEADIDDALERILEGRYEIEERMMLRGTIEGKEEKKDYSLNDIILTRYQGISVIGYNIFIDDQFLCSYYADGLVVATPTGSTGYNMSAGGPIIEPSAHMILMTPICPHTLNSRSLLFSPEKVITLEILKGRSGNDMQAILSFDGNGTMLVQSGDRIQIKMSKKTTKIIRLNRVSFLDMISKKFVK
jgi:NAD+ kinase